MYTLPRAVSRSDRQWGDRRLGCPAKACLELVEGAKPGGARSQCGLQPHLAVSYLLRSPSHLAQPSDAQRVVPLGQSYACLIPHQIAVIILRHRKAQRSDQKNLPPSRLQQIRATHNLRDAHGCIVNDHGKVVRGNVIAPPENEVSKIPSRSQSLWPEMQIVKTNLLTIRHAKSPIDSRRRRPSGDRCLGCPTMAKPSGPRHSPWWPAGPGIQRIVVSLIRSSRRERHVASRAPAGIDHPLIEQRPPCLQIPSPARALHIRSKRASAVEPFIPLDPEPAQIVDHGLHELGPATLRIQIFISQNELSATLFCPLRRDPERARVTDMQQAGGRRRKPSTIRF